MTWRATQQNGWKIAGTRATKALRQTVPHRKVDNVRCGYCVADPSIRNRPMLSPRLDSAMIPTCIISVMVFAWRGNFLECMLVRASTCGCSSEELIMIAGSGPAADGLRCATIAAARQASIMQSISSRAPGCERVEPRAAGERGLRLLLI